MSLSKVFDILEELKGRVENIAHDISITQAMVGDLIRQEQSCPSKVDMIDQGNSDSASNYVDRVRLRDPSKLGICATPGRGSGWRQKSLSNIDLTTNHKTNGVFRYRDFDSIGVCDLYSKNSDCAEYDDLYGVNPKAGSCHNNNNNNNHSNGNIIYDHTDEPELFSHETEACSLRRTRSLAIIREETFNDLRVQGARNRRSQLIPRARLVDRSFFKDRYNFIYDGSISGLDTLTSETQDTESQYSTAKRNQNRIQPQYPWQQDKSDLESIDSSIFKNSQHQNGIERPSSIQSSIRTEHKKHLVSRVDVHSDNLGVSKDLSKSRTNLDAHIKLLEQISLTDDPKSIKHDTSEYSIKEEDGSGITVIEIKNSGTIVHQKEPSVISYDSIYLSSESSEGKQTVFEDPNCTAHRATESDLIAISIEVYDDLGHAPSQFEQADEKTIDTLYSQVTKPKIIEAIPKKNSEKSIKENFKSINLIQPFNRAKSEIQYSSLPNAEIDNILRKSERIDAKLRFSYHCNQEEAPLEEEPAPDYDTVQRPKQALPTIPASGPSSIEESDKGAPSIEVIKAPTKDISEENKSKIYIQALGLEIDYANSVVTTISDPESDIDPPPSVTLGGKKVIVDEVAAKAIKRSESNKVKQVESSAENIYDEVVNLENSRVFRPIEVFKSTYEDLSSIKKPIQVNQNKELKKPEIKSKSDEQTSIVEEIDDKPITVIKVTSFDRRGPETRQQVPLHSKANAIKLATFSSLIKDAAEKMPRPQLLQIVDKTKGKQQQHSKDLTENYQASSSKAEFLTRVNSVHNYWSKILEEVQHTDDIKSVSEEAETSSRDDLSSRRTSIESSQNSSSYFTAKTHLSHTEPGNDFQSFCPSVEIVELDGQKKAAIVKAKNFDEVDFDHVRYRVIKSDVFQKRMIINNRKEAQFDGLLQYLQDYSFQELLANNNVVIIEPVRTKIEKPSEKKPIEHSIHCKITGGAGGHKKNALKQNFFYHPIRVNKELLDEELPSPDTVRNVRSMFEHRFGLGTANTASKETSDDSKINTRNTDTLRKKALRYLSIDASNFTTNNARKWDSASLSSGVSSGDLSSPCECNEDNGQRTDGQQMYASEDNLCRANEEGDDEFESHYVSQDILEKIRERGETVTYYGGRVLNQKDGKVSAMTKALMNEINNHQNSVFKRHPKDQEYLGMKFKLIKSNSCSSRLELAGTGKTPPDLELHHNRHLLSPSPETVTEENEEELQEEENKSNEIEQKSSNNVEKDEREREQEEEVEETVRDIVSKLEHKSSVNKFNNRPRIVEFHPKVKIINSNDSFVTINSQPIENHPVQAINNQEQSIIMSPDDQHNSNKKPVELKSDGITVNNHITYSSLEPSQRLQQRLDEASARASKICRNKDVDLAFSAINPSTHKFQIPINNDGMKKMLEKSFSVDTVKHQQAKSKSPMMLERDELDITPTHLKRTDHNSNNNEKQYDSLDDDTEISERSSEMDDDDDDEEDDDENTLVYKISNSSTSILSDSNNTTFNSSNKLNMTSMSSVKNTTATIAPVKANKETTPSSSMATSTSSSSSIISNNSKSNNPVKPAKTVSWTTLSKFDEKLYCVNDKKLIEKKTYDEMDFEEFEVFDPAVHGTDKIDENDSNEQITP
uniref:CSON014757 protein n=1 Tax=Culicoides sonorensis TaxID=179676 RepID=A0A336MBL4_CULSO